MVTKRTYKQIAAAVLVLIITLPLLALIIPTETRDLSDLSAPTPATKSSLWFSLFSSTSNSRISQPGTPIMGAMKNETIKAELGRSAWRLLHTMAGKFPAKPTQAQMTAMNDFIYLFGQLYPCGDCCDSL
ncbi:hypothetical protein HK100_006196 [Physocladia obscura]|uniref:Sulfhydryl oxidase n=1 Tax=Physocladia obscura TaxID=109957 RepID=A0AAD5T634_9FUNG|nr:hypothetical protein HK100_006196 [Physocladia obscura]